MTRAAIVVTLLAAGGGVLAAWHWLGWIVGALLAAKIVGVSALMTANSEPDEESASI
jgi:hypothetical protein